MLSFLNGYGSHVFKLLERLWLSCVKLLEWLWLSCVKLLEWLCHCPQAMLWLLVSLFNSIALLLYGRVVLALLH